MEPPSTVTEAIALLRGDGYVDDVDLFGNDVRCARTATSCSLTAVQIDRTYRFEGDSDPADEAIVLGLRFPDSDVRAVLVSAFGQDAEPEMADFLAGLRSRGA